MSRMDPAVPPYPRSIQTYLDKLMPEGIAPLYLFRVLARDERLFARFMSAGLLDRGHLTMREREVVMLRVCANEQSEYERARHTVCGASRAQSGASRSHLQHGARLPCWSGRGRLLLAMCDELRSSTKLSTGLWRSAVTQMFYA